MILKEEIDKKAIELGIKPSDVQRDYLFGWLLYVLFTLSSLKNILFLKGGNALRKGYFLNTRFSSDLDFGIPNDITIQELELEINKACDLIQSSAGITFIKDRNTIESKFNTWKEERWLVYEVKIYFRDFYGKPGHIVIKISLDVTRFDKTILPIQELQLIHPYSDKDVISCKIKCMKLEEILATKMKCLLQREHAPDLFDFIYSIYLNREIEIDHKQLVQTFLRKTIFERCPNVAKNLLLKLPFDFVKACWVKSIVCVQIVLFDADYAISNFCRTIEKIFDGFPEQSYYDRYFFDADLRNPIFKAAREQTLIRFTYDGFERLAEPYALKFQQPRDKPAKEYLYAYDTVGGNSGPGIKRFVPDKISSIENTDKNFDPRYEIEICKAGEPVKNKLLYDPTKTKTPSTRSLHPKKSKTTASKYYGPQYVFQCNYCGKKFTKRSYNATLNPHKNKDGYPCSGRSGWYVETKYS